MAKGDYEFPILVTCLLILALQIHNPFQSPRECHCDGNQVTSPASASKGSKPADAGAARRPQQQQPSEPPVYRKPRDVAPAASTSTGLSTDDLLRELDTIQVKAKEQQEVLAAAGKMPPASPILQQLKESEASDPVGRGSAGGSAGSRGASYGGGMPAMVEPMVQPMIPQAGYGAPVAQAVPMAGFVPSEAAPPMLQRRDDIGRFLQAQQRGGLGIVLGVGRGDFALRLLSEWSSSQGVFLVDPYIHIWRGYDDPANLQDTQHQMVFEELRNRLSMFEGRYVLVRDFSHSFAEVYQQGGQPGPPTFVYIDANHAEQAVARDLELWWPTLASGGLLGGSTYMDDGDGRVRVKAAVDRFAARMNLQMYLTHDDAIPSWFIFKP